MAPRTTKSEDTEKLAIGSNPEEAPRTHDEQPYEENDGEIKAKIAAANDHMRRGLQDPSPSVRAAFRLALEELPAPGDSDERPYDGPWVVKHRFRYVDAEGKPAEMDHLMPLPNGEHVPRILRKGDIPDDVAQHMWAEGAIDMAPRKAPKPRPRPRTIASPLPTHFR